MNVRVEYDPTPIRHISVQCPRCDRWFYGYQITDDDLRYDYQINFANFTCPICDKPFSGYDEGVCVVKECGSAEEVYKNCLGKKVSWE